MDRDPTWDAYEEAVMAGKADMDSPGDDYEMSERFKDWLVAKMRDEVMGQISDSGLDRMTIIKADVPSSDESE